MTARTSHILLADVLDDIYTMPRIGSRWIARMIALDLGLAAGFAIICIL